MSAPETSRPGPGNARRRAVSAASLVRAGTFAPDAPLPLVVEATVRGVGLRSWLESNLALVSSRLAEHGGILLRGFDVDSIEDFESAVRAVSGELLEYSYGSTPRHRVSGGIYTSTEYPAAKRIPLHNEMSYSRDWPMRVWFHCVQPAEAGGETPIADSRKVFARIDPSIRDEFSRRNVLYVRNYGHGIDVPWEDVFQTSDRAEVERQCRRMEVEFEWLDDRRLRTRQVCQATVRHPDTGESVWFNQAHLFHVSNLDPADREVLLARYAEEDLPRNAYYGDGAPIADGVLAHVREAYRRETVSFPWRERDTMLLDNVLCAHGREPFEGTRRVVVGMAVPCR